MPARARRGSSSSGSSGCSRRGPRAGRTTGPPREAPDGAAGEAPLSPEHFLVLTYNVKAARELQDRLDKTVGTAARARMTVTNFHSFCQRILTESAADAGLPSRPDVLDGVGQVLLLKDILPDLPLIYHYRSAWALSGFVQFINRAKDELVTPDDFDAYVADERRVFEERYGSFEAAEERLAAQGNLQPLRKVRSDYAGLRTNERAEDRGETPTYDPEAASKTADREARRTIAGTGRALFRTQIDPERTPASTPWPRPTKPMAPRSRSCA